MTAYEPGRPRMQSISQASQNSQTAQDYINDQLQLEADAREALPYAFDTCTRSMGALRQSLFACLTCNPPPASPAQVYTPAGVCYSCSISCHGEHELVELFNKRHFVCDCGTKRISSEAPCTLRLNETTKQKGDVKGQEPAVTNQYNHNFENKFCGCGEIYDAHKEKGTMFQCVGLGSVQDGGCGEDWWHPECLVGLSRRWYDEKVPEGVMQGVEEKGSTTGDHNAQGEGNLNGQAILENRPAEEEAPLPPGFPNEEDFEHLLCYKCVEAFPWIKRYAGAAGFLPSLEFKPMQDALNGIALEPENSTELQPVTGETHREEDIVDAKQAMSTTRKRKAEDGADTPQSTDSKKQRFSAEPERIPTLTETQLPQTSVTICRLNSLPPAPTTKLSLFLKEDFRENFCRCPQCFPLLARHPQLLEEEDTYEPPLSSAGDSEAGDGQGGTASVGSKSLLDRGEAALSNMDRVRAIEGVMAYNHLKAGLKDFLKPFADSGQAVGAEDIKAYFEKLRGDTEGIKLAAAGAGAGSNSDDGGANSGGGDGRRTQGGY